MIRVRVNEGSTKNVEFDITDQLGAAVPVASLIAGTLTLYDAEAGPRSGSPATGIINNRDRQDILAGGSPYLENDVTIDSSGHVVWTSQPEDNVILVSRRQIERHRAQFLFQWDGGTFPHEVELEVVNLRMVS